jgi:hypothetical protein
MGSIKTELETIKAWIRFTSFEEVGSSENGNALPGYIKGD